MLFLDFLLAKQHCIEYIQRDVFEHLAHWSKEYFPGGNKTKGQVHFKVC